MPVLKLKPVIPELDEEDPGIDILVKTDIQGTAQSERYCLPEELIVTLITDLHLQLTHLWSGNNCDDAATSGVVPCALGQDPAGIAAMSQLCTEAQPPSR